MNLVLVMQRLLQRLDQFNMQLKTRYPFDDDRLLRTPYEDLSGP